MHFDPFFLPFWIWNPMDNDKLQNFGFQIFNDMQEWSLSPYIALHNFWILISRDVLRENHFMHSHRGMGRIVCGTNPSSLRVTRLWSRCPTEYFLVLKCHLRRMNWASMAWTPIKNQWFVNLETKKSIVPKHCIAMKWRTVMVTNKRTKESLAHKKALARCGKHRLNTNTGMTSTQNQS